ncbi:phage tail sheath C-terminal domain-containing protein [Halosimplex amylolyticum]|uniref:phage tail sheath C-terminal domain-containing protein n=1 Tax=Halosimplex amylolyticum TaxID=3396616 RepID=UPI003F566D05
MPQYKAPGVYVEEVERGAKPIEGVGTSTPGFLGETERGPEDPRLVTSFADYRRWYGSVVEDRYLSQAVEGFFQNGGGRCYVGRVAPASAETAEGHLPTLGVATGHLQVAHDTLDFGRVAADQTPTREVEVEPIAELGDETVTITNLEIANDPDDDFELETEVPDEGLAVEAGEPEPIAVTFTHTSGTAGDKNAELQITASGEVTTLTVALTGEMVEHNLGTGDNDGEFGYSTGTLDFGDVAVGDTAAATVTLQNLGDADMMLAEPAISIGGGPFEVQQAETFDGRTVESTETVDVLVLASPETDGDWTPSLTVDNQSGQTATIDLDLNGVFTDEGLAAAGGDAGSNGDLATAGTTFDYGTFVAGNTRTITLHNRGAVEIRVTDVDLSGGGADAFRIVEDDDLPDEPIPVPGGGSAELTVVAQATDADSSEATATVTFEYDPGTGMTEETLPLTLDADVVDSLIALQAIGPGPWGAGVAVTVEDASLYDPDANDLFQVTVRYWSDPDDREDARAVLADPDLGLDAAPDPDVEEVYDNLTPEASSSDHYGTTLSGSSVLVDVVDDESRDDGPRPANGTVWLDADFPNDDVVANDYDGVATDPEDRTGFAAFEQIDEIAMVGVPDEHEYDNGLSEDIVTHCLNSGDRFAILNSPPSPPTPGDLRPTENSDFAAFYYPWLTIGHPETGRDQNVPPCGHVAGIYARSDQERGVHKAPANEQVRGIRGLQKTVSKGDQETLNPRGVNCIRTFRGRGTRVWGARTTSSDPAWKYVNVRRLFLFVEESIEEGTQWVVFEPNDERLWARVRQTIRNFLTSVWNDGALMGSTAEEAFYVKCDRSTMTQNDIDNGRLICEIGIAPVKPAEFVVFRISQTTAGGEA